MQIAKRSNATLIEVVVALSLTALLLGSLFAFPYFTNRGEREASRMIKQMQADFAATERLNEVLCETTLALDGWFFTGDEGRSLIFCYNNGIDRDPLFSAEVLGKLYLSREGQLILASWPHPMRWNLLPYPYRQELLMSGVTDFRIECFEPPPLETGRVETEAITEGREQEEIPHGWQSEWKMSYQELPALVRLTVSREAFAEPLHFACMLIEGDKHPRFLLISEPRQ